MNKELIVNHYFNRLQDIRRLRFKEAKKDICINGISEHFICNSFYELCFSTRYKTTYKKSNVYLTDWGINQDQIRSYLGSLCDEDRKNMIWDIYQDLLRLETTEPLILKNHNQAALI